MRLIIGWFLLLLVLAGFILVRTALATPSFEQVKRAANLYPGRQTQISVDGQIVTITLLSIQQLSRGRYAVIVEAK